MGAGEKESGMTEGKTEPGTAFPALEAGRGRLKGRPLAALEDPDAPEWSALLGWQQAIAPGASPRAEATLFLGQCAFFLTASLLDPETGYGDLTAPDARAIAYQLGPLGDLAAGRIARVQILGDASPDWPLPSLFEPVIAGLSIRTGSSRGGLWRVAGDGVAAALLAFGREHGCLPAMHRLFRRVLKSEGTPFFNRRLRWPEEGQTVLERGGCCRLFEIGMALCPGCVLNARRRRSRPDP